MNKTTRILRADIVNRTINYIYLNIDIDLNAEDLAIKMNISTHHLHRIFKEETSKNLHDFIQSIRLQKAATLLLTNKFDSISHIALLCGYSSQPSFIKAFKKRFNTTPKLWKKGDYLQYANTVLQDYSKNYDFTLNDYSQIFPKIVKTKPLKAAYIRHKGYDSDIKNTWNKLYAWALQNNLPAQSRQIGLYHDNPTITVLKDCAYVAAITIDNFSYESNGTVTFFELPGSVSAVFNIKGNELDILNFIKYIYQVWLPNSGYEAKTLPSYVEYKKNYFLNTDEEFEIEYYLPVNVL